LITQLIMKATKELGNVYFEHSPVALWEEDFSEVNKIIETLKKKGVKQFKKYFDQRPDLINECAEKVKIINVNRAVLDIHEVGSKKELLSSLTAFETISEQCLQAEICIHQSKTVCILDKTKSSQHGNEHMLLCFGGVLKHPPFGS